MNAPTPIVCLFAPLFYRPNIKSSQRKSTKHRQQTHTNTRKRQEKGRLIYICARKTPCKTAIPHREHSGLQAKNDNIAQNRLGRGKTSRKIQHTQRYRNAFGKNPTTSEPKIHTPGTRSLSQNSSIFYKIRRHSAAFPARSPQNNCKNVKAIGFTVNM